MIMDYYYLGSPYSAYEEGLDAAFELACKAAAAFIREEISVISPIAHSHAVVMQGHISPRDNRLWSRVNAPIMRHARGLIVLKADGWEKSKGLAHEIEVFMLRKKPVHYIEVKDLDNPGIMATFRDGD